MAKKKAARKITTKKTLKKTAKRRPALKGNADLESVKSELQSLLEKIGTGQQVLELLLSLDEAQRRMLSPMCQKHFRKATRLPSTKIAAFSTGNFSEVKKLVRDLPNDEVVVEVLTVRKPDWVGQFVELLLGRSYYWQNWSLCRELVRRGLCAKPENPRYYTGIITSLAGHFNADKLTVLAALRKDPDLLKDEIWRLFEYEGEDDNTLANVDRWEGSKWSSALVTLSNAGKLPRAKLLDAALGALELGFNHYRARWFFDFFDLMEPTDQELKKRATRILGLIGNPAPNVDQWAFEKQQLMVDLGLIKATAKVIETNVPRMGARHKKTVLETLALFDQIAATSRKAAREVCRTTAEALSHEKADVQKAAFKLIEKHGSPVDQELRETVEKYATVASATVKKQLETWLASGTQETPVKPKAKQSATAKAPIKTFDLKEFDALLIDLLSLKPLAEALEGNPTAAAPIPAAVFDGTDIPRLDPERRLTPIADLDELLETLGRVIEDDSLIDDAEWALEGLVRLHADKPDDFDKRIGPLHKRAGKLLERKWSPFTGQGVVGDLCGLILAWKSGEPVTMEFKQDQWGNRRLIIYGLVDEPIGAWRLDSVPLAFLSRRMLDLVEIVIGDQPRQLLSAPTHAGGWIDPAALVERINGLTVAPPESDVILSLLRLAPDGRAPALKKLKPKLKGEWLQAVKHGMGADGVRVGKTAALWAAAARCRSPLEADPKVAKAFPKLGPGAGKAMRFKTRFRQQQTQSFLIRHLNIVTTEELPEDVPTEIPSQLFQRNRHAGTSISFHDIGTTPGSIRWLATLWPASFQTFFATGAECIGGNLDWWEAEWHNRSFLEPLLDADTPLLDMGEILLLCGLAAKEPGEHGLAVDISLRAIDDGRLGTDNMSRMLTTAVTSDHFNLPRLAKRLQEVAGSSDLHAYVVMHSLESGLPHADAKELPRGIGDLFELLAEIGTRIERGVESPDCRTFLETITGSNKAAKAARQLLTIETNFDSREVIASAVANRVERLQEWQKRK